ncbi:hypothetical protein Hanom_Chr07g00624771 [Helianthus anomalus]
MFYALKVWVIFAMFVMISKHFCFLRCLFVCHRLLQTGTRVEVVAGCEGGGG